MDIQDNQDQHLPENDNNIELTDTSLKHLDETRKWANFFAILGFIGIAFMIIAGFSFSAFFSYIGSELDYPVPGYIGFVYIVLGLIYFFPILYLYRFSALTKNAVQNKDPVKLNSAFKNLKSHYRFIGIFTIVFLVIYFLFFVIILTAGMLTGIFS